VNDVVRLTTEPLSLDVLMAQLGLVDPIAAGSTDVEVGAVVTFSGVVRPTEGASRIGGLDYEAYASMAEGQMRALVAEARGRWRLGRVGLVHRTGPVEAGRASVLVVVGAGHRAEAFEAARWLIDELKAKVPIWKRAVAGNDDPRTIPFSTSSGRLNASPRLGLRSE